MALIAIGDIHGCAKSLDGLLDRLDLSADNTLVFVGDYIDRGPNSKGVIDRLLKLRTTHDCIFLRGNHERFMLDYLNEGALNLWSMNGGVATIQSYQSNSATSTEFPSEHVEFVRNTELYYETDEYFFVHGGLKPQFTIAENLERFGEDMFLWERNHLDADTVAWEKTVVCGHTPRPDPINRERLIMIDTGCVYDMHPGLGRLTAVRLPERSFVDVPFQDD